jgi:hypothetical protein
MPSERLVCTRSGMSVGQQPEEHPVEHREQRRVCGYREADREDDRPQLAGRPVSANAASG